jgi:hypothetical protein
MSILKTIWALTPIGAVVNIIKLSNEHGNHDVVESIIGSAPYYTPNDSGIPWVKVKDDPLTYERVVRKGRK